MSAERAPKGKPVWDRGRVGRFWGGFWDYARTAWWGIASPHISESSPLVIAQAVILRAAPRRQVLLSIRSDLFGWELPGGTLRKGESASDGVVREVREETGLDVEVDAHVGDWVRTGFRPHTARVYRCRVLGGREAPSHETPRLGWFDVEALPADLFAWYHAPLRESLATRSTPFEGEERQGLPEIWQAMKIDVGMRWRGLPPDTTE
jgi:ADP-ribose pyrophosphatase YjhB (NUDIX family)